MSTVISACLLDCQNAVKEKKYDAALDALKTALQAAQNDCKADPINILDHRVAVYLNMECLDLALKDAKVMIRHDRKDGRGYLRCGQVERLLGNPSNAINWYKQGLKRVPSTHRSFSSLQKQMEKVEAQVRHGLIFTRASDPMLALPLETVELILSFLNYKQIIGMIRVSRSWNKLLCSLPPLTDTMDYRAPKRSINVPMLRATLRKLRVPKSITATRLSPEARQELVRRLQGGKSFTELRHLELRLDRYPAGGFPFSKYNLKSLVLGAVDTDKTIGCTIDIVGHILRDCPNLEVLAAHDIDGGGYLSSLNLHCPALRKLEIHTRSDSNPCSLFAPTLATMPSITELSFSGVFLLPDHCEAGYEIADLRSMKELKTLRLNRWCIAADLMYFPATIQDLGIHSLEANRFSGVPDEHFTHLTNLRSLDLELKDWPEYLAPDLMPTEEESNLSELSLHVDQALERRALEFLESGCVKRLRHLTLRCQSLNDNHSATFIEHLPQLENLTLSVAAITGVFIMDLLKAPQSRLKEILLCDCLAVSRDIVPWAQARNVKITIKKTVQIGGQRRVREAH